MTIMLRSILLLVLATSVFRSKEVGARVSFNTIPMVKTEQGTIYGKYQSIGSKNVATFLGVPYAKPPVGPLRFRRPVLVEVRDDPIYALRNAPACMQSPVPPTLWADLKSRKSEDCLYLNIWVPESRSCELLPVMFWIHGGSFTVGSNGINLYDGKVLAALGEVIVVTVNYRLGPFGFLYLNVPDAPRNAGLFDIVEALKWVHKNIGYFGGDKDEITLFGESAGGMMVGSLGISHLTRSLFKRMIFQSGAPIGIILFDGAINNLNRTIALAKRLGCAAGDSFSVMESEDMIDCLRGVDADQIIAADTSLNTPVIPPYYYQYGDELLEMNPLDSVMAGDIKDCEVLIGANKDEGSDILTSLFPNYFGIFGEKNFKLSKPQGYKMVDEIFPYVKDNKAVVNYYYADVENDDYENIAKQTYKIVGDMLLLCPSVYSAEKIAEKNNVFYYSFEHRPSVTQLAEWMGASHFEEIQFVFGQPLQEPERYSNSEQRLSMEMINIWTSFAKTGRPESSFGSWPLYSRHSPQYKILNTTITNSEGYGPEEERCNFLRMIFKIP